MKRIPLELTTCRHGNRSQDVETWGPASEQPQLTHSTFVSPGRPARSHPSSSLITPWLRQCLVVICVFGLVGCGPGWMFGRAERLQKKGKYYRAWEVFQEYTAKYPSHERAPEALFRAGWLAQKYLNDCFAANTFFQRVMERYPQSDPWAKAAQMQSINCPDYFPLVAGNKWVEGDRESQGQIARTEIVCEPLKSVGKPLPSESGTLSFTYFAGGKSFKTTTLVYRKSEGELLEFPSEDDPRTKTILKWPLAAGQQWATKSDQKIYHYEVKEVGVAVKVVAGEFKDCIKVGSYVEGSASVVTNEYYAPNVGRVLKTISTSSGENRITELLSYNVKEFDFFPSKKAKDKKPKDQKK